MGVLQHCSGRVRFLVHILKYKDPASGENQSTVRNMDDFS